MCLGQKVQEQACLSCLWQAGLAQAKKTEFTRVKEYF
jgi:hypothetical protein